MAVRMKMKKGGNVKTEYLTAGGSLTNGSPRTLKSRPSESLSTKKRFFILYLGNLFVTLQP